MEAVVAGRVVGWSLHEIYIRVDNTVEGHAIGSRHTWKINMQQQLLHISVRSRQFYTIIN